MTKEILSSKFEAKHTLNGYVFNYSNGKTKWVYYTNYSWSMYADLAKANKLKYKTLINYRKIIISKSTKKIAI